MIISNLIANELKPQTCVAAGNQLGEAVTCDAAENVLYWVDMLKSELHLLDGKGHRIQKLTVQPGFVAVLESGDVVVGGDQSLMVQSAGGYSRISIPDCVPGVVINDGVVSPDGHSLVFGTRDIKEEAPLGAMLVITATEVIIYPYKFTVFNGPAFSPCGQVIYFTDSPTGDIWQAEFDSKSGMLQQRRLFAKVPSEHGYPDGMCTDDEGCLWSAHWDGSRLTRYGTDGLVNAVLPLPVTRPTSVVFGGPSRSTLYVTSAMPDDKIAQRDIDGFCDGDLLSLEVPLAGPPSPRLLFNPLDTLENGNITFAS